MCVFAHLDIVNILASMLDCIDIQSLLSLTCETFELRHHFMYTERTSLNLIHEAFIKCFTNVCCTHFNFPNDHLSQAALFVEEWHIFKHVPQHLTSLIVYQSTRYISIKDRKLIPYSLNDMLSKCSSLQDLILSISAVNDVKMNITFPPSLKRLTSWGLPINIPPSLEYLEFDKHVSKCTQFNLDQDFMNVKELILNLIDDRVYDFSKLTRLQRLIIDKSILCEDDKLPESLICLHAKAIIACDISKCSRLKELHVHQMHHSPCDLSHLENLSIHTSLNKLKSYNLSALTHLTLHCKDKPQLFDLQLSQLTFLKIQNKGMAIRANQFPHLRELHAYSNSNVYDAQSSKLEIIHFKKYVKTTRFKFPPILHTLLIKHLKTSLCLPFSVRSFILIERSSFDIIQC